MLKKGYFIQFDIVDKALPDGDKRSMIIVRMLAKYKKIDESGCAKEFEEHKEFIRERIIDNENIILQDQLKELIEERSKWMAELRFQYPDVLFFYNFTYK